MFQGGGNSGEMQPPGLGAQAGLGSPTRMEAGQTQANGSETAQASDVNVNAGAPGQAGVGMLSTTAGNSVGAGTLVGGPQMLPMAGTYGPERRQGGLMDPRNYAVFGQSSPRNTSLNGQSFQGCTGCEFNKVHGKVFKDVKDAQAVEFSKVHVKDFKAQAVEFSKVHV